MSLKRQNNMLAAFSMASMTDVIFLLLIFFMVTSTFVFPTALEINLPESSEQTALKPVTRVFIDSEQRIYASGGDEEPQEMPDLDRLLTYLQLAARENPQDYIAVYADESVTYGHLVEVLDLGARNNLKMVLATKPAPASARPDTAQPQ
ncbi:MAG: biopolymer transporter ExbD [Bacteroides sp.]|nr:biopolymer transporter ExbD [Bacteroidales bacterium]MBD5317523.1 biopolymer transporter ExbD [Bacteroides sp.]